MKNIVKKKGDYYQEIRLADCEKELFFCMMYMYPPAIYNIYKIRDNKKVREIGDKLGFSIVGYMARLNNDTLKHFYYRHFSEKQKDQRGIHAEDLKNLKLVVSSFDIAEVNKSRHSIKFIKKFPSGVFNLVMIYNKEKKVLDGKSMWIKVVK